MGRPSRNPYFGSTLEDFLEAEGIMVAHTIASLAARVRELELIVDLLANHSASYDVQPS